MSWITEVPVRLRQLLRRAAAEERMQEEIRFHLEMETEKNLRAGMSPAEARRRALVAFGGVEKHKENLRDTRGFALVERLARDARQAVRRLRREPGFAVPVVAVLSLGIGVTTAVFALVHAILLAPLPYHDADRLVVIRHAASRAELPMNGASAGTVNLYRANSRTLEDISLYSEDVATLSDLNKPEQVRTASITRAVLDVLRPAVFVDRWLPPGTFRPDRFNGVLISHALWVRRYGADPGIIGRTIELERRRASVNGVLPPGFGFPNTDTDVWDASTWPDEDVSHARLRELSYRAIARLKPGVDRADAERDLDQLLPSFSEAFADVAPGQVEEMGLRVSVVPLKDAMIGETRVPLLLLMGTAVFLLVITLANASNLALVRAARLRRTVSVERALGAGKMDLARRFVVESLVLATLGAAIGLGIAAVAIDLRFGFAPDAIPRLREVRLGATAVGVAIGLAVVSGIVLGAIAWLSAVRADVVHGLSGAGRTTTGRHERAISQTLVAGQVALALALMIGSALMAESFWRLSRVQLGFRPHDALTFSLPIPPMAVARNDASEIPFMYHRVARLDAEVLARLRALPGVQAAEAASVSGFPLTPAASSYNVRVAVADRAESSVEAWPYAQRSFATPGYFAAMGIPILSGRTFGYDDTGAHGHGAIVSASLAKALFRGDDPLGQRVRWGSRSNGPEFVVVGVVGDVPSETIRDGPTSVLYLPNMSPPKADTITGVVHIHIPNDEMFVVRTALPVSALLPAIQRIVRDVDPKLLITHVGTLEELVADDMARTRLTLLLLMVASTVALVLGLIGVYGVLSYTVHQRTNELGIRIALGQSPGRVVRMVVWQGGQLALAGIVVGAAMAVALTRFLRSLLYEVSPTDPLVLGLVAALLFVVALAASYLPARRAGRIDPVRALRG